MRIIDALPNYDMQVGFPWGGFEGVPSCMALAGIMRGKVQGINKAELGRDNWRKLYI